MSPVLERKRGKPVRVPQVRIGPQPGPQEMFASADEDVVIYGGAAGGGKSFGLLIDALRYIENPRFGAVIFRRLGTHIMKEGSLWDKSEEIYPMFGAVGRRNNKTWTFPSGGKVTMSHLEHDKTRFEWQGTEIAYIGFDELTEFTEKQFWYMLSRNRSTSGIRPRIRATCNPDCDSFVAKLVEWYIDPATGYAIEERSGVTRWFVRDGDAIVWGATRRELEQLYPPEQHPGVEPLSFTFIKSNIDDNPKLTDKDPKYLPKLMAMSTVDRERLRYGNWKIRAAAGLMFKAEWFEIVDEVPIQMRTVRYWDRAATPKVESNDPAWTAGVKGAADDKGIYYVLDVRRFREAPTGVERNIVTTAGQDTSRVEVYIEQDPGQAGVAEAGYYVRALAGYSVMAVPVSASKVLRANPASAQAGARRVKLLRGPWNKDFLDELENFPDGKFKDQVDAFSGMMQKLLERGRFMAEVVKTPPAVGQERVQMPRGKVAL